MAILADRVMSKEQADKFCDDLKRHYSRLPAWQVRDFFKDIIVLWAQTIQDHKCAADRFDSLAREHAAAIALLRRLEWSCNDDCPACGAPNPENSLDTSGHASDCPLAALLADQPAGTSGGVIDRETT